MGFALNAALLLTAYSVYLPVAQLIETSARLKTFFNRIKATNALTNSPKSFGNMAGITKTKHVKKGEWRTLESGWNAQFWVSFFMPKGAQIKVRYGTGWPAGWDSQKQTLDGERIKILKVTRSSLAYARVQVSVKQDVDVTYTYFPGPYDGLPPL